MDINIKNMVCNRCIMVVLQIFEKAGVKDANVQMGKVSVENDIPRKQFETIEQNLNKAGFEIIENHTLQLVEKIKILIIDYVHNASADEKMNLSTFLCSKINLEYNYMSSLFSSVENTTIEHFMISIKIERVKELLVYDEKTLSEIAFEMGYSSVAHLSGQFKKVTGFTPSYFKKLGTQKRKSIDNV
ncbi:MAG: helix-turn-helix domain-containing protein [Maribacter sp.]